MVEDNILRKNRFLASLSVKDRSTLAERAVEEDVKLKTVLYAEYETPRFAFLPLNGVASVVAITDKGETSEVGFIGCEGLTGAYHLLGPAKVSTRCFVQVAGRFIRIPFSSLRSLYDTSKGLRVRLHEFVQVDSLSVSQMAGCNQIHSQRQRLARWLLMADDRHRSDSLPLTHEILGEMIATRRTTVTQIVGALKARGLISSTRGTIRIHNRRGLQSEACPCYDIAKTLFGVLYK